jgi:hypothetical protein
MKNNGLQIQIVKYHLHPFIHSLGGRCLEMRHIKDTQCNFTLFINSNQTLECNQTNRLRPGSNGAWPTSCDCNNLRCPTDSVGVDVGIHC